MLRPKARASSLSNTTHKANVRQTKHDGPTNSGTQKLVEEDHTLRIDDNSYWGRLVRLLCQPADPASLGTLRFCFGFLMALDIVQERGLAIADSLWGNDEQCRFPLFHFLYPLPLQWMYVVYLVMLAGAVGVMLGFQFQLSSVIFLASYWYVFFLDKTAWNNHSYLYGILAFLLAISDANKYWSLDGAVHPQIGHSHIPLWNYTVLRAQIFIVYFIAGLKKLDMDWISGYPMQSVSHHWIFHPVKYLLTESQIDLYVVHLGGLTIDLCSGFLLFFDKTRPFGLVLTATFHLINSQLFSIGMFPYVMLVMQLVFCDNSWPRKFFMAIPAILRLSSTDDADLQPSTSCIYPKIWTKSEMLCLGPNSSCHKTAPPTAPASRHKLAAMFTLTFLAWQCFLPYSHGITKGYNSWTNGLYGYSWDMMVHSWSVQHIRITFHDRDTGKLGYIHPLAWSGGNGRWSGHGDMIKQYAHCIAEKLERLNMRNISLYFDIWRSLNYRFQQRMVDPGVDMLIAEWSPFQEPSWVMPLITNLSEWRPRLNDIKISVDSDSSADVVFVADFPGMFLETYIQPDFGNTTITVLSGQVIVELAEDKGNISLSAGNSLQVLADTFQTVHTVSETPSCFMYTFVNTTRASLLNNQFETDDANTHSVKETLHKYSEPANTQDQQLLMPKEAQRNKLLSTVWQQFTHFFRLKYKLFMRSFRLSSGAIYCLVTGYPFSHFLNATYQWEATATSQK